MDVQGRVAFSSRSISLSKFSSFLYNCFWKIRKCIQAFKRILDNVDNSRNTWMGKKCFEKWSKSKNLNNCEIFFQIFLFLFLASRMSDWIRLCFSLSRGFFRAVCHAGAIFSLRGFFFLLVDLAALRMSPKMYLYDSVTNHWIVTSAAFSKGCPPWILLVILMNPSPSAFLFSFSTNLISTLLFVVSLTC